MKNHFGLVPWKHGNTGNHNPRYALTFSRILELLQFIKNYAEQYAILPGHIPGFKRDDVKVLPSSDTKKVCLYEQTQNYR